MNYKFEAYSIVGVTILLAGLLRLYVYYKGFRISILPFLEPGEIGTIFFDSLLYFLGFTVLNVIIMSIFYSGIFVQINTMINMSFFARLSGYGLFKIHKIIAFIILGAILYWIYYKTEDIYFYEYLLWILLLVIAIYINPIIIFESKRILISKAVEINQLTIFFLIASLNLFAFAGFSGFNEANKVKNHGYYKGTEFTIDGSDTIISNDKKYFIGKTKQFLFFYDSEKKETDVIPISNIKKMKY